MNHRIFIRRRGKVAVRPSGPTVLPLNYVTSVLKNIEALGFTFSEKLVLACRGLSVEKLSDFYQSLLMDLQTLKGVHAAFRPMYPNFPDQVMAMEDAELYWNAMIHSWTSGTWLPPTTPVRRKPLLEHTALQVIDLGTVDEFESIFGQIVSSNASLSEQDREDLAWYVTAYRNGIDRLLPPTIPQKENRAILASLLITHTGYGAEFMSNACQTATDVLRVAVALSGGDVSLADKTKFRNFSRAERRLLLGCLERSPNAAEDMLRWKGRWIRLGEKLHPGEYQKTFPKTAGVFAVLRNDLPFPTFNSQIEAALSGRRIEDAVRHLSSRPGDLARRLDHLLRIADDSQGCVLEAFSQAASAVSTPILLQIKKHFESRNQLPALRVFFPKGNLGKAHVEENRLPSIPAHVCQAIVDHCVNALLHRFAALPPLGKVYLDAGLSHHPVPFAIRSGSKSFCTLTRGSRLPLPEDIDTLRFFVWWKNGKDRTDIDLSAAMFDADFGFQDVVSYYNLKTYGGVHSGDIVDAPQGASEFIDVSCRKVADAGIRFVVMTLTSYTQQPYAELPECCAGWMSREQPGSGEIYEPRTVKDRLDITANTCIAIPLIFDLAEKQMIWCDMALRNHPRYRNHVHGNLSGIALTLQSLVEVNQPTLYDLFLLHIKARGEQVGTPAEADTVFSIDAGTPYRREEITSQYMA